MRSTKADAEARARAQAKAKAEAKAKAQTKAKAIARAKARARKRARERQRAAAAQERAVPERSSRTLEAGAAIAGRPGTEEQVDVPSPLVQAVVFTLLGGVLVLLAWVAVPPLKRAASAGYGRLRRGVSARTGSRATS